MGELILPEALGWCLGALGALLLVCMALDTVLDRYDVLILPGRLPRVFRMWFAPGSEVYHADLGRCEVARLDRTPDLAMTWICVQPLDEEHEGWVPAAHWVPLVDLGETPEEAERMDDPEGGGPP